MENKKFDTTRDLVIYKYPKLLNNVTEYSGGLVIDVLVKYEDLDNLLKDPRTGKWWATFLNRLGKAKDYFCDVVVPFIKEDKNSILDSITIILLDNAVLPSRLTNRLYIVKEVIDYVIKGKFTLMGKDSVFAFVCQIIDKIKDVDSHPLYYMNRNNKK